VHCWDLKIKNEVGRVVSPVVSIREISAIFVIQIEYEKVSRFGLTFFYMYRVRRRDLVSSAGHISGEER
jgi:hypothetical protein